MKIEIWAEKLTSDDVENALPTSIKLKSNQEMSIQYGRKPSSPLAGLQSIKSHTRIPEGESLLKLFSKSKLSSTSNRQKLKRPSLLQRVLKNNRRKKLLTANKQIDESQEWNICQKFCYGCCGAISISALLLFIAGEITIVFAEPIG